MRIWTPDILGDGFEMTYVAMPDDYSGKVRCTIIRKQSATATQKAILYVHGFSDYFLQKELAEMFARNGYNFYAVELRKYGRSLMPGQKMFQVRNLEEYFDDIDAALHIISEDDNEKVALLGHSTGGLTASLYASVNPNPIIKALMLNSPFLDWNLKPLLRKYIVPVISTLGSILPNVRVAQNPDRGYAESLHKEFGGEWDYNRNWKPDILPNPDMGWIRAIHTAQKKLRNRLIHLPILLMHSAESVKSGDLKSKYKRADAILDVQSSSEVGRMIGENVTEVTFPGALHDLALSEKSIRQDYYRTMLNWLDKVL